MKKNWLVIALLILVVIAGSGYILLSKKSLVPSSTILTPTLMATPTIPTSSQNIKITEPKPLATVDLPFTIRGKARVFESQLNWRIKDVGGNVLVESMAMANSPDAGQFGPFEIQVSSLSQYRRPTTTNAIIEIFDYSAKDGSEQDKVIIPVSISFSNTSIIKVFFGKKGFENDCQKVFPISLAVGRTVTPARSALEELLKGPTRNLSDQGYSTSINEGVVIQKLTIDNGVARVDFNKKLEEEIGGSCRVTSIRSQITQTLLQFSSVKMVVISIDGQAEDILQP